MPLPPTLSWPTLEGGAQPLGILPPPEGLLLLPHVPDTRDALAALLAGDLTGTLPKAWEPFHRLLQGDRDAALALLGTDDPLERLNRFFLTGNEAEIEDLSLDPASELSLLVAAARYVHGLADHPPASAESAAPELEGVLAWVAAAWCVEQGRPEEALGRLEPALTALTAVSPLAASQVCREVARIEAARSTADAEARLRQAIALAGETPLPGFVAEIWFELALLLHEAAGENRGGLVGAIDAYQTAIHRGLSLDHEPEGYALAQNNLGLAYLSLPMSGSGDALRGAVAVQSFREALKVYGKDTHPEAWASAQLNLANALQHLPSAHPQENLVQAVSIYDELLAVRSKAIDPVGYARLLANQANALAHLGMFQPALAQLDEARKLFEWHNERALAASVMEQVERIHEQRAIVAEAGAGA